MKFGTQTAWRSGGAKAAEAAKEKSAGPYSRATRVVDLSSSATKGLLYKGFRQPYVRGEEQELLPLTRG